MRLSALLVASLALPTLFADSISVNGFFGGPVGSDSVSFFQSPASAATIYTHKGSIPALNDGTVTVNGSDNIIDGFGRMGYEAGGFIADNNGFTSISGLMDIRASDGLTISASSGFLRFDVLFEGQFRISEMPKVSFPPGHLSESFQIIGALNDSVFGVGGGTGPNFSGSNIQTSLANTITDSLTVDENNLTAYKSRGTLDIPFSNGQFELDLVLNSQLLCVGYPLDSACPYM